MVLLLSVAFSNFLSVSAPTPNLFSYEEYIEAYNAHNEYVIYRNKPAARAAGADSS